MNTWQTVWAIAGMRHGTKRGEGKITVHQFEVLQAFVQNEAREAMANSVGTIQFFDILTGNVYLGTYAFGYEEGFRKKP